MAKLEGYECDTCGKTAPESLFNTSWYQVFPPGAYAASQYFCSKPCLIAAATGTGPVEIPEVEIPEKPRVLLVKPVKALLGM